MYVVRVRRCECMGWVRALALARQVIPSTAVSACRCSSGLGVAHALCADKWFRLRGSSVCEVCEAECVGLPLRLRADLLHAQLAALSAAQGQW